MRLLLLLLSLAGAAQPRPAKPDPDRARAALEAAVRENPDDAGAWRLLALVYEKKGMKAEALAAWKSCAQSAKEEGEKEIALKHVRHLESPGAR